MITTNISVTTNPKSFIDLTSKINKIINNIPEGVCNIFIQHTSCSLIISENYDNDVLKDLETFMSNLVKEDNNYKHSIEGPDDMPAHIRSVLTATSLTIPVINNKLALGTWQAIYLWEHRDHPHERNVIISITN